MAELCGGAGGTGTLLVRRGYTGGPNFDVVCGIGVLNPCNKALPSVPEQVQADSAKHQHTRNPHQISYKFGLTALELKGVLRNHHMAKSIIYHQKDRTGSQRGRL